MTDTTNLEQEIFDRIASLNTSFELGIELPKEFIEISAASIINAIEAKCKSLQDEFTPFLLGLFGLEALIVKYIKQHSEPQKPPQVDEMGKINAKIRQVMDQRFDDTHNNVPHVIVPTSTLVFSS